MVPQWPCLFAVLPILVFGSGPDNCTLYESTFHGVSPELESLMCYNDYKSQVICQWKEEHISQDDIPLELWNWDPHGNRESPCEPIAGPPPNQQPWLMRCRFHTSLFAISINHTFFFKATTATSCSPSRHHLNLSQHLRVRPPVDLAAHALEDGDRLIQWSSPYPASSPLSHNLTYQLSYRREGHEWTDEVLTETHLRLRKHLAAHHPGCWYEARVRAMGVSRGRWSEWSPLVTWKSPEAADHTPSMQCVLDGEDKVTCSWELREELARFVTYQVECRHKQPNYISKRCCVVQEVTPISVHSEALLRYSCSLTSRSPEHLTLKLIPELNAKSFTSHRHIRPNPPVDVSVSEKGGNWIVQWKKPETNLKLSYQVQWNAVNEEATSQNISEGLTSLTIKGASLGPSQLYQVRVRALLPGRDYTGLPSEWTQPEKWQSHAGSAWCPESILYVGLIALACFLFFGLFFSIQACRRRIIAWLRSGPSPTKSKLFLEIKKLPSSHFLQEKEILDVCRVTHLDSFSSCSHSETGRHKQPKWQDSFSEDEGCLDCHRLTSSSSGHQHVCSETSAVSFNGPYIFCKGAPEPPQITVGQQLSVKKAADAHSGFESSPALALTEPIAPTASSFRDGYVFLPNPGPSKPTEGPVTHGNHGNNDRTTELDSSERAGGQYVKEERPSQAELPSGQSNDNPPPYTPMQCNTAPQGGVVQPSGYCILP